MKKLLNTLYITSNEKYLSLDGETVVISEHGTECARDRKSTRLNSSHAT